MNNIPNKIKQLLEENSELEWVESQDKLNYETKENDLLSQENQLKFWHTNCAIRKAINEIRNEIKTSSGIPSKRIIGWSELARRANCDRNTLKQINRFEWVEKSRNELLAIIDNKQKSKVDQSIVLTVVLSEEEELDKIKIQLEMSKKETAKWFVEYQEVTEELKIMNEALMRQLEINSALTNEISTLKKQNKALMATK